MSGFRLGSRIMDSWYLLIISKAVLSINRRASYMIRDRSNILSGCLGASISANFLSLVLV